MKRNYGIDLLRLVLMFMVVVLHVLGHGGVLSAAQPMSGQYITAWLMESLAIGAVNSYAIITGYVQYGRGPRLAPVIQLWIQGLLYSLGIAVCLWVLKPQHFSLEGLLYFAMPVSNNRYWYLGCYIGLSVIMPFLNLAIDALDGARAKRMLAISLTFFSVVSSLGGKDSFGIESGYSVFWLACLYVLGACIQKFGWFENVKSGKAFVVYLIASLGCWVYVMVRDHVVSFVNLFLYTSPLVLLGSLALFHIFRSMRVSASAAKWISAFSPAAFGVYLIHEHELIKDHVITGTFSAFARFRIPFLILMVLVVAAVIFAVCLLLDLLRHKVFQCLKVKERLEALEHKLFPVAVE